MDTARYNYETQRETSPKAASTESARKEYERLQATYAESTVAEQAARKAWDAAKAELNALERTKKEAMSHVFAMKTKFYGLTFLQRDFVRAEGEALGGNLDDWDLVSVSALDARRQRQRDESERKQHRECGFP